MPALLGRRFTSSTQTPPPHHPTSLIPNQSIFEMTVLDKMQKVAELSPSVDDFCKNVVFSELSSRFGPI